MKLKCQCCGKFRKDSDVVEMSGDSDDCGGCETWTECRFCCAQVDVERYWPELINSGDENG